MSVPLFGIDLGSSQVKIAALRRSPQGGGAFQVVALSSTPIAMEARRDPDARLTFLGETLQQSLKGLKIPVLAKAAVAVSGPEVTAATLLVPGGTAGEVRKSVQTELERLLPYPISEALWNVHMPPAPKELEGGRVSVFVIAAPRRWIRSLIEVFRSFRLVPTWVTASASPLPAYLLKSGRSGDTSPALLDIGFSTSTLTFAHQGCLEFLRTLPVGADHFARGLMRTVATPGGEHAITASEAESILRIYGIGTEEVEAADRAGGLSAAQVYGMLRPTLEYLYLEVQRTLHYYNQAFARAPVERIFVCGGGACIPHLVEFLNANMDLALTEPLNLLDGVAQQAQRPALAEAPPRASAQAAPVTTAPQMAVCLAVGGLELKGASGSAAALSRSDFFLEWMQWVGVWVACAGLAVTFALSLLLGGQQIRYWGYVRKASAQVAGLEEKMERIREVERLTAEVTGREALVQQAVSRKPLWDGVLKELSRITPEGIRLTSLQMVRGAVPPQLKIEGEILPSYTSVEVLYSQYQLALEGSPFFTQIRQGTMEKDLYSPSPKAVFQLTCQLVY